MADKVITWKYKLENHNELLSIPCIGYNYPIINSERNGGLWEDCIMQGV